MYEFKDACFMITEGSSERFSVFVAFDTPPCCIIYSCKMKQAFRWNVQLGSSGPKAPNMRKSGVSIKELIIYSVSMPEMRMWAPHLAAMEHLRTKSI